MDSLASNLERTGLFGGSEAPSPSRDRIRFGVTSHKVLARVQLTNLSATIASVPTGETWVVRSLRLHNTDSVDRTVTLRDIPSGGVDTAVNNWINLTLSTGETVYVTDLDDVWESGYTIKGLASVTSVINVKICGVILVDS